LGTNEKFGIVSSTGSYENGENTLKRKEIGLKSIVHPLHVGLKSDGNKARFSIDLMLVVKGFRSYFKGV